MSGRIISDEETISILNKQDKIITELKKENEQLKSENKELMDLIQHCYENWSDEKKKVIGNILNGLVSDVE